jgi:hypothetical protein
MIKNVNLKDLVPKCRADTGPMELVKQEKSQVIGIAKSRLHGGGQMVLSFEIRNMIWTAPRHKTDTGRPKIMPQDADRDGTR